MDYSTPKSGDIYMDHYYPERLILVQCIYGRRHLGVTFDDIIKVIHINPIDGIIMDGPFSYTLSYFMGKHKKFVVDEV